MKTNIKLFSAAVIFMWSVSSLAGVLMSQWTEGTSRYCKYSDGEVIEISFGSTCPSTN